MKLNEQLGIKYPILQGGMANIATGSFAAAVSNAGGLGIIGAGGMDAESLRREIRQCAELTDKPFGVNIMLLNPESEKMAQVVCEEKVFLVTTGAGNPGQYVKLWKEHDIKVFPVVSAPSLAIRMASLGVDGIIAEGTEGGGHIGEMTTMTLVPQICAEIDLPVIAAGGIASGRQMLAAEALGAAGVQIGTLLLVADECPIHENYKNRVLKARSSQITVTGRIGGTPVRLIRNPMSREYIAKEKEGWTPMQLEVFTLGSLKKAVFEGDLENGSLMAGLVVGQVNQRGSVKEILEGLYEDYLANRKRLVCS